MPLNATIFSRMAGRVVKSLRENAVAPRLINTDFGSGLATKNQSLTINFPGPVPQRSVIPANIPPVTANPVNNAVTLNLDQWEEAAFTITDSDLSGLENPKSYISQQLEEGGRTIANAVDRSILSLYRETPFTAGTAGTTPFASSLLQLQSAETTLINNIAPSGMRSLIVDPFAYGNALGLNVLQNNPAFGNETITEGRIKKALGYDWAYDQNVQTHTRGVLGGVPVIASAQLVGTTALLTAGWTPSIVNLLRRGDVITIAGDANPYVVTADVSSSGTGTATILIYNGYAQLANSGALVAPANAAAITVLASHKASLALHPNFATIVSRIPDLLTIEERKGHSYRLPWVDPVSGLAFMVKITEQHWQTEFSVSCLWGVKSVWTQFGVRLMG